MLCSKPAVLELTVEGEEKRYEVTYSQVGRFPESLLSSLVNLPRMKQIPCTNETKSGTAAPATVKIPGEYAKEMPFVIELYKTGSLLLACKQLPSILQDSTSLSKLQNAVDFFQLPTNELLDLPATEKAVEVETRGQPSWPMADAGADQQLCSQEGFEQSIVGQEVSPQFVGLQSFLQLMEAINTINGLQPTIENIQNTVKNLQKTVRNLQKRVTEL